MFIHTSHLRTGITSPTFHTASPYALDHNSKASDWREPLIGQFTADMTLIVTQLQEVLSEICEGRSSVIVFIVSRVRTLICHQ